MKWVTLIQSDILGFVLGLLCGTEMLMIFLGANISLTESCF
jgi:hypothetical protein